MVSAGQHVGCPRQLAQGSLCVPRAVCTQGKQEMAGQLGHSQVPMGPCLTGHSTAGLACPEPGKPSASSGGTIWGPWL